jgi:hypothetical protein
MTARLLALALVLFVAAGCDTRVPPTMSQPGAQTASCPAGMDANGQCKEEHSFFHRMMPWNWF